MNSTIFTNKSPRFLKFMALIFKLIENDNKLISLILEAKQQKPIQLL